MSPAISPDGSISGTGAFPLTVLVHEGPIARAYLAVLKHVGIRPSRILKLVYKNHPGTGRRLGGWLFGSLREKYAETMQDAAFFYWPRQLHKRYPGWIDGVSKQLALATGLPETVLATVKGECPLTDFCDTVDRVFIDGLADPALYDRLSGLGSGAVLFTGGGIVPKSLLSIPGLRLLHVHPGIVPDIKGADGLLWSTLLKGRPGASCFYMSPGLDTGDVIAAKEYDPLVLPLPDEPLDHLALYRVLYAFCDPFFRATLLAEVLSSGTSPDDLPAHPQAPQDGVTYHFMHGSLRRAVLGQLFSQGASPPDS